MKSYSITRRLVTTVLLVELLLTGSATAVALLYERNQLYRAFDVMLRGRADSMLGAVQDAEDPADTLALQTASLDIPHSDLYEVRTDADRLIARSPQWNGMSGTEMPHGKPVINFVANGKHYRGLFLKGIRLVDTEGPGPGIVRKVVVFYASPTHRIWNELWEAARFLIFFNSILLVFTGAALVLLLRRSMAPLNDLAFEAAHVSAQSWHFEAPAQARAARELNALVNALESVLKRLERSFQQQRNFVNDAAHELKTALTVVKSSLQLLDYRDRTAEEYKTGLGVCLSDCDRMEDLVQRLLTLARAEQLAGEAITANHQTSVAECVRNVVVQLESVARMRGVRVLASVPRDLFAEILEDDCATILTNILLNAIQHSPPQSEVKVTGGRNSAGEIRLDVQDQGEGISAQHLPFIFERFYRGDASRSRETGGTGLGLAICRAIVDAYGGDIAIESQEGRGTLVTILLRAMPLKMADPVIDEARK